MPFYEIKIFPVGIENGIKENISVSLIIKNQVIKL